MTISVSFSSVSQIAPKAAGQLNGMLQVAASMQAIRRDSTIPEAAKQKLLEPLLAQTKFIEDEVNRKAEEKEKATAVASAGSVSDAVAQAAAQASADGAAGQPAADGAVAAASTVTAVTPAPEPVATYTPDATVSQAPAVGSVVDTFA